MKFTFGDKTMDFTKEEVMDFLHQAESHGVMLKPSSGAEHYLKKAKENIERMFDNEIIVETEADAKKALAKGLCLSCKEAELLYEVIEFAIGMRLVHAENQ